MEKVIDEKRVFVYRESSAEAIRSGVNETHAGSQA
jgi:hypothetical protein